MHVCLQFHVEKVNISMLCRPWLYLYENKNLQKCAEKVFTKLCTTSHQELLRCINIKVPPTLSRSATIDKKNEVSFSHQGLLKKIMMWRKICFEDHPYIDHD